MIQFTVLQKFILAIVPILFAITIHEVAHGWVASKCGDKTALMLGRLTLNPIKHIDVVGTVILPILLYFTAGFVFGWAKPVPVSWQNLKNPKRDMAWVALAGPLANLLMALGWALIAKLGLLLINSSPKIAAVLAYMGSVGIIINLVLIILNLLPIPPLDGSRVVSSLLPNSLAIKYSKIEPFGILILLALVVFGALQTILQPILLSLLQMFRYIFGI